MIEPTEEIGLNLAEARVKIDAVRQNLGAALDA